MQKSVMALCIVILSLVISVSASFAGTFTVTVTTDKATYARSQQVVTTAEFRLNGSLYSTTTAAKITIKNPSGSTLVNAATMSKVSTGVYRYTYTLSSSTPYGTYTDSCTLSAGGNSGTGSKTFSVAADTTAPVTTASPAAGTYASAQTVTLTRNEAGTTYYTTNGTTPTTSSTVYSAPITISATTTLKYFSRDTAGNSEAVKTGVYTISPHSGITSYAGPQTCIACHNTQAQQMLGSLHMQWKGATPNVTNAAGAVLGKAEGGINSFCTYAMSSQAACFNCHVRLDGNAPDAPTVNDIDCMMCHNDTYQRKIVTDPSKTVTVTNVLGQSKTYTMGATDAGGNYSFVPDYAAMPAGTTMVGLAQTVHKPTRKSCLRCHAKAGGADWAKRGDMGLNTATPTLAQDVHMSAEVGGGNLTCASCHKTDSTNSHKVGGRGIDLRQTEAPAPKCTTCHTTNPHGSTYTPTSRPSYSTIPDNYIRDRHGNEGVGCMTCHIDKFGKGGATEMSRDWLVPTWNAAFCNGQGGFVGEELKQPDVTPEYVLFDGTSYVYSIGDKATDFDGNGKIDMAKANGKLFDGKTKVVPIKRHFSVMPVNDATNEIIPPQITWMFMTGTFDEAVWRGMQDFGYYGTYTNKPVEAEMLIAHGVAPKTAAKACTTCHNSTGFTPDTYGPVKFEKLGYHVWPAKVKACILCHSAQTMSWKDMHNKHAEEMGKGCIGCHTKEPTGWKEPPTPSGLCNNCHSGRTYTSAQDLHKAHAESEHGGVMHTTCTDCHTF